MPYAPIGQNLTRFELGISNIATDWRSHWGASMPARSPRGSDQCPASRSLTAARSPALRHQRVAQWLQQRNVRSSDQERRTPLPVPLPNRAANDEISIQNTADKP
jgi:hypothetical protein